MWRDGEGEDARYYTKPFIFVPGEGLRERSGRDSVPYGEWIKRGLMKKCEGSVINFRQIRDKIRQIARLCDVQAIGFDRKFGHAMMVDLQDDGLPVIEVQQGWVSPVPAVERLGRAVLSRRLVHGGHDVLRWMVGNTAPKPSAGGRMLTKRDRNSRIDAVTELWMAMFCEMHAPPPRIPLYCPDLLRS